MIDISIEDRTLIELICDGLPLAARPYQVLGNRIGMAETEVIERLRNLIDGGVIRRFGVVVQHRRLGYTANGMSVWNVPDARVREVGEQMGQFEYVTLCYQRPRHAPSWPYNLFAMVHGAAKDKVLEQVKTIAETLDLTHVERDVLFSRRQFKQCGARYGCKGKVDNEPCKTA